MKELLVGTIVAVNISKHKGTEKVEVDEITLIEDWGIENDAHAGKWHRQVSLLSYEKIQDFNARGAQVANGAFGENIIIEGFDLKLLPVGTRFYANGVILELTQIGKECHSHCAIYHRVGDCIMPREGVFTKVVKGGKLKKGNKVYLQPPMKAAIITASDRSSRGEREDLTTGVVKEILQDSGFDVVAEELYPDDLDTLAQAMKNIGDRGDINLLITTGGTGFSKRDVTPEATMKVVERLVPGIAELMRYESLKITKRAILSRAVSGIYKDTLIVNLPGSPKGAKENLLAVIGELRHGLKILLGSESDCAAK